jgi:hypothetical protein
MRHPTIASPALALLLAGASLAGCAAHARQFEAVGADWTAPLRDRTGSVEAVLVSDAVAVGEANPRLPALRADALCVTNKSPNVVRIGWLGGTCTTAAVFNLAASRDGLELRYDLDPACEGPSVTAYAIEVTFDRPVDAAAIRTVMGWEP